CRGFLCHIEVEKLAPSRPDRLPHRMDAIKYGNSAVRAPGRRRLDTQTSVAAGGSHFGLKCSGPRLPGADLVFGLRFRRAGAFRFVAHVSQAYLALFLSRQAMRRNGAHRLCQIRSRDFSLTAPGPVRISACAKLSAWGSVPSGKGGGL